MSRQENLGAISTCPKGAEKYVYFNLTPRAKTKLGRRCQYEYRHLDGQLFACIGHTLEHCREKRDKWLESISCD
ncbi:MAG: DUF3873 family protein [Rikenellaceae bacterium]